MERLQTCLHQVSLPAHPAWRKAQPRRRARVSSREIAGVDRCHLASQLHDAPVYWPPPMHELVIRNALLLDGSGSSPRHGDVGVKDGRIAEIGEVKDSAKETIDAGGLALMPGIIDNHTHYDAQLTWDPSASPSPALGVTTAIIGNCGFTIA